MAQKKYNKYNNAKKTYMYILKVRSCPVDPQKSRRKFQIITGQNFQHHIAPLYSAVLLIIMHIIVAGPKDKKFAVLS